MSIDLRVGDVLELKKTHTCGGNRWQVTRLGADIGLRCLGCQRHLLLERRALERRIKAVASKEDL